MPSTAVREETLSVSKAGNHPNRQNVLSFNIEDAGFKHLYSNSSTADNARLPSVSSPRASYWLLAVPLKFILQRFLIHLCNKFHLNSLQDGTTPLSEACEKLIELENPHKVCKIMVLTST